MGSTWLLDSIMATSAFAIRQGKKRSASNVRPPSGHCNGRPRAPTAPTFWRSVAGTRCVFVGAVFFFFAYTRVIRSYIVASAFTHQTLSFYQLSGAQLGKDRELKFDPCALTYFGDGEYLLLGGSDKKVTLWTKEGVFLNVVAERDDWVWAVAARPKTKYLVCLLFVLSQVSRPCVDIAPSLLYPCSGGWLQ
jgi:hypothetical protein